MSWIYLAVICVGLGGFLLLSLIVLLVWGFLRIRQSHRQAEEEIKHIELADIPSLVEECVHVFQKEFGFRLDLHNFAGAAEILDNAFSDQTKLKDAFAREECYWHFVKPMGACLGELLRLHANHSWTKEPNQPPCMTVRLRDGESTVYPFEKILKQISTGEAGDIIAYVELARTLGRAKQ